jgi:hypothetical protein
VPVPVYLFGYLSDDIYGRVLVVPNGQTVGQLADQLRAWGPSPAQRSPITVTNESGHALDPGMTIVEAGLENGDIFTVRLQE